MNKKTENLELTEEIMINTLMNSGYLMESRIIKTLSKKKYFVEPNQRIYDKRTEKSREIDFIAQYNSFIEEKEYLLRNSNVSIVTRFICEAKNNPHPIILMTELPFSPEIEDYESLYVGQTGIFLDDVDYYLDFYKFLTNDKEIYTQYCSFKTKGNTTEWMVIHPDDFYDDLEKIITYSKENANNYKDFSDDYNRLHIFLPVVVVGGDILIAHSKEETIKLSKVKIARFMQFHAENQEQKQSLVIFVSEKHLLTFFDEVVKFCYSLEKRFVSRVDEGL